MSERKTENPEPIRVPVVNRETGAVTMPKEYAGQSLDGWSYSEDCHEGGLTAVNGFNDAMSDKERDKAVSDFNQKPSNRII
jgi:hypothetical protein